MFSRRLRRLNVWAGLSAALAVLLSPALGFSAVEHRNVFEPWMETSRILNFLIVLFALYFFLRKPIRMAMGKRREGIGRAIKEAEEARAEAKQLREECERRTAELEKELAGLRAQAKAEQEALRARLLEEGNKAADRMMDHARFAIEQETKKAEQRIRAQAALLALELAEKALERELGAEDQQRFIRDYIHKVGEMN